MSDYEHAATIGTNPDALFAYLSDINNLPDYFEAMVSIETIEPGAVHVVAEVEGHRREGRAWFEVNQQARSMRWGSEGENNYHGELDVAAAADAESTVTVTLHTERVGGPGIRAGLEQTLANIKRQIEGSSTRPT